MRIRMKFLLSLLIALFQKRPSYAKINGSTPSLNKNVNVLVTLELDDEPEETSWRIEDVFGEVIVDVSPTYYKNSQRFKNISCIVELERGGTYVFFPSFLVGGKAAIYYLGDAALGSQLLGYQDSFSNGNFFFFVASPDGILDNFFPTSAPVKDYPSYSGSPFASLSSSPSQKSSNPSLQALALFVLTTDAHPNEIVWSLSLKETNSTILRIPSGSYQLPFKEYSLLISLGLEENYQLTICNNYGSSFEGRITVYLAEEEDNERILVDYNERTAGCNYDPIVFTFSESNFIMTEVPTAASTPLPGPFPLCEICGQEKRVHNPVTIVHLTKDIHLRCDVFELLAIEGFISESLCSSLPSLLSKTCDCKEIQNEDFPELPSLDPSSVKSPTKISQAPSQTHLEVPVSSPSTPSFDFEDSPGYPVCYLCGEDYQISNSGLLLDIFAGENTRFTCGQLEQAALQGFLSPAICNALLFKASIEAAGCICDRKQSLQPTTFVPTAFPSIVINPTTSVPSSLTDEKNPDRTSQEPSEYTPDYLTSPIPSSYDLGHSPEYPPCHICREGYMMSNPELVLDVFAGDDTFLTCGIIEQAGVLGFIMPIMCNTLFKVGLEKSGCTCDVELPPPLPSEAPSPLPSSSPSSLVLNSLMPSSDGFESSPGYPLCNVCGEGSKIINPDLLLDVFAGHDAVLSCGQIEQAGLQGFLLPMTCGAFLKNSLEEEGCICGVEPSLSPTSFHPSIPSPVLAPGTDESSPTDILSGFSSSTTPTQKSPDFNTSDPTTSQTAHQIPNSPSPSKKYQLSENNFEDKVPDPIPEETNYWNFWT